MLEYAGVLIVYLIAVIDKETGRIEVRAIHNLQCPLSYFPERISRIKEEAGNVGQEDILEIYCILGTDPQTKEIVNQIAKIHRHICNCIIDQDDFDFKKFIFENLEDKEKVNTLPDHLAWIIVDNMFGTERLYALQQFHLINTEDNLKVICLGMGLEYEDSMLPWMEEAVRIWMNKERPQLLGKQVMIQSFLLDSLKGRRIIAVIPNKYGEGFFLLLEGGRKIPLGNIETPYMGEQIGYRDINMFSTNDINTILQNPIYAYGIWYQPYEVFEQWQHIFQYTLAVLPVNWTEIKLQTVYEAFLDFIKKQICKHMDAKPQISKKQFFESYKIIINQMRKYLRCKEEEITSKDWIKLVESRHIYIDKIHILLKEYYPLEIESFKKTPSFKAEEFLELLDRTEKGTAHMKGVTWEDAAEYMLERIPGLKLTGKRISIARQEIDLCCVNVSTDENLWNLGALILVECKNWNKRVDTAVIRNIGEIMRVKGTKTTILFSKNGLTRDAISEIRQLALMGEFVLYITKSDFLSIKKKSDFYDLLIQKWRHLEQIIENDLSLLG